MISFRRFGPAPPYNDVAQMTGAIVRRRLAAGALALYGIVVGFLVPLHALLDAAGPRGAAVPGPSVEFECHDRDCHEPTHHHHGHAHDPATCVSCAQAKVLALESPAAAAPAPEPLRAGAAVVAAPTAPSAARRAIHPARGPPVLS